MNFQNREVWGRQGESKKTRKGLGAFTKPGVTQTQKKTMEHCIDFLKNNNKKYTPFI